jgi:hypothetical protein
MLLQEFEDRNGNSHRRVSKGAERGTVLREIEANRLGASFPVLPRETDSGNWKPHLSSQICSEGDAPPMANLFEFYALLFEVFAFTLLALVCISLLIVALHCAVEVLRGWDFRIRSRRDRRKVLPLVQIG